MGRALLSLYYCSRYTSVIYSNSSERSPPSSSCGGSHSTSILLLRTSSSIRSHWFSFRFDVVDSATGVHAAQVCHREALMKATHPSTWLSQGGPHAGTHAHTTSQKHALFLRSSGDVFFIGCLYISIMINQDIRVLEVLSHYATKLIS